MTEMFRCTRCADENPIGARFCIKCGNALTPASTGPTTRLAVIPCPQCHAINPEHAHFCVVCGAAFATYTTTPSRPTFQQSPPIARSYTPPKKRTPPQIYPRIATRTIPTQVSTPPRPHHRRHIGGTHNNLLFLIGIFILLATHMLWPGILLLIGLAGLVSQTNHGHPHKGLSAMIWWGGLALLFTTHTVWPGIVILTLITIVIGNTGRSW